MVSGQIPPGEGGALAPSVVLAGCGNIGFRHLQALSAMTTPVSITVIEPAPALHPRIEALIAAESAKGLHDYHLVERPEQAAFASAPGLAVIATNSFHRRPAWEGLRALTRPGAVIFEKVLFPRLQDLEEVGEELSRDQIAAFVNCGRRGFPGYQALARRFAGEGKAVSLKVSGAAWGLASNLVHFLDLAEFLNGSPLTSLDLSGLEPGAQPSKRGDYLEVFGRVRGQLENGATVEAFCAPEGAPEAAPGILLRLQPEGGAEITLSESAGLIREGAEEAPFAIRHVSGMPDLYEGLFHARGSVLTPYAASARQHRIYLNALRPHLGLSNARDDRCPVS